jgi:hypothetical protein
LKLGELIAKNRERVTSLSLKYDEEKRDIVLAEL